MLSLFACVLCLLSTQFIPPKGPSQPQECSLLLWRLEREAQALVSVTLLCIHAHNYSWVPLNALFSPALGRVHLDENAPTEWKREVLYEYGLVQYVFFFSVIHCKTFCYWVPKWTRPRPQCRFISGTASLCDWLLTAVRHKARVVMKWFNCSLGEPPHLLNPSSALLQIMRHGIVSLLVETQCNLSPQTCMKHTNNFLTDTVKSLSLSCISYCLGRQLLLQQRDSNVLGLWSWDGKVWEWTTRQGVS